MNNNDTIDMLQKEYKRVLGDLETLRSARVSCDVGSINEHFEEVDKEANTLSAIRDILVAITGNEDNPLDSSGDPFLITIMLRVEEGGENRYVVLNQTTANDITPDGLDKLISKYDSYDGYLRAYVVDRLTGFEIMSVERRPRGWMAIDGLDDNKDGEEMEPEVEMEQEENIVHVEVYGIMGESERLINLFEIDLDVISYNEGLSSISEHSYPDLELDEELMFRATLCGTLIEEGIMEPFDDDEDNGDGLDVHIYASIGGGDLRPIDTTQIPEESMDALTDLFDEYCDELDEGEELVLIMVDLATGETTIVVLEQACETSDDWEAQQERTLGCTTSSVEPVAEIRWTVGDIDTHVVFYTQEAYEYYVDNN